MIDPIPPRAGSKPIPANRSPRGDGFILTADRDIVCLAGGDAALVYQVIVQSASVGAFPAGNGYLDGTARFTGLTVEAVEAAIARLVAVGLVTPSGFMPAPEGGL
jgi:hypothetical protein